MTSNEFSEIKELIQHAGSIAITAHKSPDGDAVGASLGLYHFLKKYCTAEVTVVLPDPFPDFLNWLPAADSIFVYTTSSNAVEVALQKADIIFCLDYNQLHRTGGLEPIIEGAEAVKVLIDHHQMPGDFCDYMMSDTKASSTAELIYSFIDKLGQTGLIDSAIASSLYTGLVTDTGSFRFSSTSSKTMRIVAELMDKGLRHNEVYDLIFDNQSYTRLKLMGFVLGEKLAYLEQYHAAYISLSQEELKQFNYKKGDTEGLVNYGLSIKGVKFAAFFRESSAGFVKISFRSKGDFDVNKFARSHFSGGGHINAAGGRSDLSLEETEQYFKSLLPKYEEELSR